MQIELPQMAKTVKEQLLEMWKECDMVFVPFGVDHTLDETFLVTYYSLN